MIDVEQYHVDKMSKGKAIQDGHNPFSHVANGVIPMDVDGYTVVLNDIPTGVQVAISTNGSNPFLAAPSTTVQHQTPNVVMEPSPSSRPVNCDDASASSEAVTSAQANYLRDFKRFDTVDDFSDHHYASKGKASKQVMITNTILSSQGIVSLVTQSLFYLNSTQRHG